MSENKKVTDIKKSLASTIVLFVVLLGVGYAIMNFFASPAKTQVPVDNDLNKPIPKVAHSEPRVTSKTEVAPTLPTLKPHIDTVKYTTIKEKVDAAINYTLNYFEQPYNKHEQDSLLERLTFLHQLKGLTPEQNANLKMLIRNLKNRKK